MPEPPPKPAPVIVTVFSCPVCHQLGEIVSMKGSDDATSRVVPALPPFEVVVKVRFLEPAGAEESTE